jgi:hypothetical protein
MPLKLNIGVSKKIGEAHYGSRGASVNLELELESSLIDHPGRFKERVRQLFRQVKSSVEDELNNPPALAEPNGAANGKSGRRDATRRSTASQLRALNAVAERHEIDLAKLLRERFGIELANELTITEASHLIDELKAWNGQEAAGRP